MLPTQAAMGMPDLLKTLFGKNVGGIAPAFQPGTAPTLGATPNPLQNMPQAPQANIQGLLQSSADPTKGPPAPEVKGPPAELAGPPAPESPTGLGAFFSNLDQGFASPSKQLGLGLLGQIDPRLGYAGLLGQGLLGPNKVWGQ